MRFEASRRVSEHPNAFWGIEPRIGAPKNTFWGLGMRLGALEGGFGYQNTSQGIKRIFISKETRIEARFQASESVSVH